MTKTYNLITSLALLLFILVSCKKDDVRLGETVLYETDFSKNDEKWGVGYSAGDTYYGYENGVYVLKGSATMAITSRVSEDFAPSSGSMYVEVSVKPTYFSDNRYGHGGLIWNFRKDGTDLSFYALVISQSGEWKITRYNSKSSDPWEDIVDWSAGANINIRGYNTLTVLLKDGKVYFHVNDQEVYSMAATGVATINRAGLYANRFSIVEVNHFKIASLQ